VFPVPALLTPGAVARFDEVRAKLDNRLREYVTAYRSVLGDLVLAADPRST
jgi:hypothetical protein